MRIPRKPSLVREMTAVEAAWVGAMVEGEGCISLLRHTDMRYRTHPTYVEHTVSVFNTEVETIATVLRLVGDGAVRKRKPGYNPKARKPAWVWELRAIASLADLLRQIRPYLTGKQAKADEVLQCLDS